MCWFYYFHSERSYDVLKSKSTCILSNKNINFNKNQTESKMENPTNSFRKTSLVLQLMQESPIKSKTVMSWSSRKRKRGLFLYRLFCPKAVFLRFVFHLNVQCVEHNFRRYILLHIKKHYFIHFCRLFLKSSKTFSVSLSSSIFQSNGNCVGAIAL